MKWLGLTCMGTRTYFNIANIVALQKYEAGGVEQDHKTRTLMWTSGCEDPWYIEQTLEYIIEATTT
jgi:hypothetical protein